VDVGTTKGYVNRHVKRFSRSDGFGCADREKNFTAGEILPRICNKNVLRKIALRAINSRQ
jgi:hypothetical protein